MKNLEKRFLAILLIGIVALFSNTGIAQEETEYHPFVDQSFLIISSNKDYESAEKTAKQAEKQLELKYPASIYFPDEKEGFKTDEACDCGEIHGYSPRGRYDDGNYVSIEYSSAYEGFSEGYYIVIVSSGSKESVEKELTKVKKFYPQSYIKNSEIYVGCMH